MMILPGQTHSIPRRQTLGLKSADLYSTAFGLYEQMWNSIVGMDRRQTLTLINVNRLIGKLVRLNQGWEPFLRRVLYEYRQRRSKANGPLRAKTGSRLSSVPLVGPLAYLRPKDALNGRVKRRERDYALVVTRPVTTVKRSHYERITSHLYHLSKAEEIGMAVTPDGLDVVVDNKRKNGLSNVKTYHVPVKVFIKPGFIQDLYRHLIAPKVNTLALDVSSMPMLSGRMKHAAQQLHRWCRYQKAVGAAEYRKVSAVGEETKERIKSLRKMITTNKLVKFLQTNIVLRCPCCDAPIPVTTDIKTYAPLRIKNGERACPSCGEGLNVGVLLASRASFLAHYAFVHHQLRWRERPNLQGSDR